MTNEERQEIIAAVLSAIRTNSALITDLTEVTSVSGDAYIELSGGRRIKSSTLTSIIQNAIVTSSVSPLLKTERDLRTKAIADETSARIAADKEEYEGRKADITSVITEINTLKANHGSNRSSIDSLESQNEIRIAEISGLNQSIEALSGRVERSVALGELDTKFTDDKKALLDGNLCGTWVVTSEFAGKTYKCGILEVFIDNMRHCINMVLKTNFIVDAEGKINADTNTHEHSVFVYVRYYNLSWGYETLPDGTAWPKNTWSKWYDMHDDTAIQEELARLSSFDTEEKSAREAADLALQTSIAAIEVICERLDSDKFDKSNIVGSTGNDKKKVMSQDAVTINLLEIEEKARTIKSQLGTVGNDSVIIEFTNYDGITTELILDKASETRSGVLTADEYKKIHKSVQDIESLNNMSIDGGHFDSSAVGVDLKLARNSGDEISIGMPVAGDRDSNGITMAGIMTADQAVVLQKLRERYMGMEVVVDYATDGDYEIGSTADCVVLLKITKEGMPYANKCDIHAPQMDGIYIIDEVLTARLECLGITNDCVINVRVSDPAVESTPFNKDFKFRFLPYAYGRVFEGEYEGNPLELILEGCEYMELTESTELPLTMLTPDQNYLFSVKGNVTLVCRDELGSVLSGCETGTIEIPRPCDETTKDTYSYIVVPASKSIYWSFKITNY